MNLELTRFVIVARARWASKAELEEHHATPYLKATHQILNDEDLVAKPEVIKVVSRVEGFEGR